MPFAALKSKPYNNFWLKGEVNVEMKQGARTKNELGDNAINTCKTFWFLSLQNCELFCLWPIGTCVRRESYELVDEKLRAFEYNDEIVFLYHVSIIVVISWLLTSNFFLKLQSHPVLIIEHFLAFFFTHFLFLLKFIKS